MTDESLLSRPQLAARWGVSRKTIDRLRADNRLPWIDLAVGNGKTLVRFRMCDVEGFERQMRQSGQTLPQEIGE